MTKNQSILNQLESDLAHHVGANWRQDALPADYDKASIKAKIAFLSEAVATYEHEAECA
jgi:hypothetical protein